MTKADIQALFELGLPYMFGGENANAVFSGYPDYAKRKCWQDSKFYRKEQVYISGFDCCGFTCWICTECGLPEHDTLSNMILRRDEHKDHYLFTQRSGMPPYEQLKDTLRVGDFLVIRHGTRHIMMYIGTLRDYGFTAQEAPGLAEYLDHSLAVHCGPHPDYGERIDTAVHRHASGSV